LFWCMPTRSGHQYLLRESNQSSNTIMNSQQLANTIAAIQAQLTNLTQTVNQTGDKLGRVETRLKNRNDREEERDTNRTERDEERDRLKPYQGHDERDPIVNTWKASRSMSKHSMNVMIHNFFLIRLNNLTSISRSKISLNPGKLSLSWWNWPVKLAIIGLI